MIRTWVRKAVKSGNRSSEDRFLREAYRLTKDDKSSHSEREGYCRDNHRAMMLYLRGKEE